MAPPGNPHGGMMGAPSDGVILTGGPFDSEAHTMQAALVRRGHSPFPESRVEANASVPEGTIAILVTDGNEQPLPKHRVVLKGIKKSIEEGDDPFTAQTITDERGLCAFRNQPSDSTHVYEVIVEQDGATYTSGSFSFEHGKGAIVTLPVFVVTPDIRQTFVFTRALYAIEPRHDVFQVQALFRFHNGSGSAWRATEFPIELPQGAAAYQPGNVSDLKVRQDGQRVLISGTFPPGKKELSFGFQLPNTGAEAAELPMPLPPHMVDAKIVVETSKQMGLSSPGFNPSEPTASPDGQRALIVDQDFLVRNGHSPRQVRALVTGLPPKSRGPLLASGLALAIALAGLAFAFSRERRNQPALTAGDRKHAIKLILDELVALQAALDRGDIGPKTFERSRRTLLDSIARLESTEAAAPIPSGGQKA